MGHLESTSLPTRVHVTQLMHVNLFSCDRVPACAHWNVQGGGVLWTKGNVVISGGEFLDNEAEEGGVFAVSSGGFLTVTEGLFYDNTGENGGVGYATDGAVVVIHGGDYLENESENGGVFAIARGVEFEVCFLLARTW